MAFSRYLISRTERLALQEEQDRGQMRTVCSSIVDVCFTNEILPPLHTLLSTGDRQQIVLEVLSYLNPKTVRSIALNPTQGLAQGNAVSIHQPAPLAIALSSPSEPSE